jgi:hypothetical protein
MVSRKEAKSFSVREPRQALTPSTSRRLSRRSPKVRETGLASVARRLRAIISVVREGDHDLTNPVV